MLVGEQPGDQEDRKGHPFVGPAGGVLDRALEAAGIARGAVYVTNAVKHFKFEQRGKRRLHKGPNAGEIAACRWWLDGNWRSCGRRSSWRWGRAPPMRCSAGRSPSRGRAAG